MGGYILCQIKRASMPYYIENISTNIYSIEELCYYFYHNIYLLDETILNEHLCDWIRKELGLERLYRRLYKILEDEQGTSEFILAVFKEINYLSHQEFKKLIENLNLIQQQPAVLREKKKGDYLLENKMYVNALRIYDNALRKRDKEGLGEQFNGGIYHNMGCAYMYLFQFEEAAECFLKAYGLLGTRQALKHYLTACCMMDEKSFPKVCQEMKAPDNMMEEIQTSLKEAGAQAPLPSASPEELLKQFIKDYHRSTGF